jgi:SAM-dependent methyltransferase
LSAEVTPTPDLTWTGAATLDSATVLADERARADLRSIVVRLRELGVDFGSPVADPDTPRARAMRLAGLDALPAGEVERLLGITGDRLVAHGLAMRTDPDTQGPLLALSFGVFTVRGIAAILPRPAGEADRVYLANDTTWMLELLWPRLRRGARAVDLGAGTGFLAASLTQRFDQVVATDVHPAAAATARLTALVNPQLAGRLHVVRADIAAGLRPGAFDLVTANPPWVPSAAAVDRDGRPVFYADGGATGFELPLRFLHAAADLLAPGGLAAVMCVDGTFTDGRRPVAAACAQLDEDGFTTEIVPTPLARSHPGFEELARNRLPSLAAAGHVCVFVTRPG